MEFHTVSFYRVRLLHKTIDLLRTTSKRSVFLSMRGCCSLTGESIVFLENMSAVDIVVIFARACSGCEASFVFLYAYGYGRICFSVEVQRHQRLHIFGKHSWRLEAYEKSKLGFTKYVCVYVSVLV